jgi:hypothetical protein
MANIRAASLTAKVLRATKLSSISINRSLKRCLAVTTIDWLADFR